MTEPEEAAPQPSIRIGGIYRIRMNFRVHVVLVFQRNPDGENFDAVPVQVTPDKSKYFVLAPHEIREIDDTPLGADAEINPRRVGGKPPKKSKKK